MRGGGRNKDSVLLVALLVAVGGCDGKEAPRGIDVEGSDAGRVARELADALALDAVPGADDAIAAAGEEGADRKSVV